MTATDEIVDLDIDLDSPTPCDIPECDGEAVWALSLRQCGHQVILCEQCKRQCDENEAKAEAVGRALVLWHDPCQVMNLHWAWRPL